jgi:Trk-type K+ transport system membrane component
MLPPGEDTSQPAHRPGALLGDPSTVAMTALMWVGWLEIVPVVVLLRWSYCRV